MVELKDKGIEVFRGFTVPWDWIDSFVIGLIEKADARLITDPAVEKLDDALQGVVDNTTFKFDNAGKVKLEKAFTMSMVERFMPELLQEP